MATETRSHNGCWSCRLRKKKCDERRPICTECMCVGLECHGFGEKPEWMDRGARQKAQAAKMKQKVAQVTRSRRMNQIRDQHESSTKRQQSNMNTSTGNDPGATADTASSSKTNSTAVTRNNSVSSLSNMATSSTIHVQIPNANSHIFHSNNHSGFQHDISHFSPPASYDSLSSTLDSLTDFPPMPGFHDLDFLTDHNFELEIPDFDSERSTNSAAEEPTQLAMNHSGITMRDLNLPPTVHGQILTATDHQTLQTTIKTITPTPTPIQTPPNLDYSTSWTSSSATTAAANTNISMLPITNIQEAILFANYLDKVFPWQFPFCAYSRDGPARGNNSKFNQGHYVWLMSRSRPLFLASLALSSSFSKRPNTGLKGAKEQDKSGSGDGMERYEIATQELQRNINTFGGVHNSEDDVAMLACLVSFIHLGMLHPTQIDWNAHLKAGTSLITPWVQHRTVLDKEQHMPESTEESARIFFTACIIRFDILSCLTNDSSPALAESYKTLLSNTNGQGSDIINLEPVSGCQNWVFALLLQVYHLRDWKRSTRAAGLLSLWELTSKANRIQTELERNISRNQEIINKLLLPKHEDDAARNGIFTLAIDLDMNMDLDDNEHKDPNTNIDIHLITQAFATALSVLLEVIVSGAYPQLPEIKHKVGRAIDAFHKVAQQSSAELIESALCWPLFVVAAVVEEDSVHQAQIRNLLGQNTLVHAAQNGKRSRTQSTSTAVLLLTPISPTTTDQMQNSMASGQGNNICGNRDNRRLSGIQDLLERCWRARANGEIRDDGFDYTGIGEYLRRYARCRSSSAGVGGGTKGDTTTDGLGLGGGCCDVLIA
ncbi:Fungal specific transcription factor domain containing protein [Rhypophila sp. PSN 637]